MRWRLRSPGLVLCATRLRLSESLHDMNLHGRSFVGSQLSSGTGQTFQAVSPLDCNVLAPPFFKAGDKEVAAALALAEQAFASYRQTTGAERSAFLERMAQEILAL